MKMSTGLEIGGLSIGGLETCIDLPGYQVAFDIGRAPDFAVARRTILFTHAHMDHLGGVAWHCATRSLRGLPPPRYVIGHENAEALRDLFAVWRRLDRSDLEHEIVAIGPGEELALSERALVRPFRSFHRVPCQGYAVWSRKTRLARDLVGKPQAELDQLRASGRSLTEIVETPEVAFCGDTLIEVLEREEVVRKARVLILEVTFLDDRVSVADCREQGHIHLDEVIARAHLFENEAIVFSHFSARWRDHEVRQILAERLPPSLRERVTPLLRS